MHKTFVLFGEAEKGEFGAPHQFRNLLHLSESLGHPPENSQGIFYAIQALLYEHELLFFRVKEEGFSVYDYFRGLKYLKKMHLTTPLTALCMPGVGDTEVIDTAIALCTKLDSLLILGEKDLYDYLTHLK